MKMKILKLLRKKLKKQLSRESKLTAEDSMKILREFESLENLSPSKSNIL